MTVKGLKYGNFIRRSRPVKLCKVKCTVTTKDGKTDSTEATVAYNKLNKLNGNSLTSYDLWMLKKDGKCTTQDQHGITFSYELLETNKQLSLADIDTSKSVEVKLAPEEQSENEKV